MTKSSINFNDEAEELIDQLKVFFGVQEKTEVLELALTLSALSMQHSSQDGSMAIIDPDTSKIVKVALRKSSAPSGDRLSSSLH